MGGSSIMASAGRVLPLPKGAYSPSTTYHLLDFVSYQGSTYICKQTSTGNAPTNTTYWQIMAQGTESASVAGNYYGTCSTGASTSAKIVSIPATENFVLQVGDIIGIKFDNTNTANNPSLNVNNSGAKPIYYNNSAVSTSNLWASGEANRVTIFMYDGTNWIWIGHDVDIDTDTLSDLKDTTISSASNGQVLMYDSTSNKWKNQTPIKTLAGLSDTQISSATDGQVLKYNSTSQKWVNGEDKGGILPHLIVISETGESVVKAVKGTTEIIATETSTGHYECDVPEFGTWTIHAVLNGDDATVNLVVDTVKVYTVDDSHFHADITVKYPSGATCNLAGQGESYYATGSPYTFTVHHAGQYTITVVYNGQTYTETVTVTTTGETISEVVPSPSSAPANDINMWLFFGGVSGTFLSLSEILANSTALSTLMASTDAVDYLVRCTDWSSNEGLVPSITNTSSSVIYSSQNNNYPAYNVFNQSLTPTWEGSSKSWTSTSSSNEWVGYDFGTPTIVKRAMAIFTGSNSAPKNYKIEGSNDGVTWTTLKSGTNAQPSSLDPYYYTFENDTAYRYYRYFAVDRQTTKSGYYISMATLQFYALEEAVTENQNAMSYIGLNNYCANTLLADEDWLTGIVNSTYIESVLNVKVPTMTSNTTPSGVVSASSESTSGYEGYKAFDGNDSTYWIGGNSTTGNYQWLKYDFGRNVTIYSNYIKVRTNDIKAKIQGSNDNSNWTDINSLKTYSAETGTSDVATSPASYRYYRVYGYVNTSQSGKAFTLYTAQFYGRADV